MNREPFFSVAMGTAAASSSRDATFTDLTLERRSEWQFQMADDGWYWLRQEPDGTSEVSVKFATLKECTADAQQKGYVAWKSEEERRRNLALGVTDILKR